MEPASRAASSRSQSVTASQAAQDRRIDSVECPATNLALAKQVYEAVFAWQFQDDGPDYASFRDGRLSGRVRREAGIAAGGPLVVRYATDLAAVEADVNRAGGRTVRETLAFPGGWRFHFTDPSGNELAAWTDR